MKEMIQARKQQMQKRGKKGFTLMEMLIVVAIIAILIAIAIPVFLGQLENAREKTDEANCRSAYAEAMATYMSGTGATTSGSVTLGGSTYTWSFNATTNTMTVSNTAGNQSSKYASGVSYNGTAFTAVTGG